MSTGDRSLPVLEMIKNGITVFNDMYWHWEGQRPLATRDMGLRGFISAVFIDLFDPKKSDEQIEENIRLFNLSEKYKSNVTFTFGPHAVYTVSRKSLEWMRDFAEKEDILIHMHLAETQNETDFSKEKYGLTPVGFLDSIGLLSERYLGCHGCMLDEEDCAVLGKEGGKTRSRPRLKSETVGGQNLPSFPHENKRRTLLLRHRRLRIEQSPRHYGNDEVRFSPGKILFP